MLAVWAYESEYPGHQLGEQFRYPEVEHVSVTEYLDTVRRHAFALVRWSSVSGVKTWFCNDGDHAALLTNNALKKTTKTVGKMKVPQ